MGNIDQSIVRAAPALGIAVENAALDEWQNVAEGCVLRALG
jgi:hypothetical protein